jgi:hypothetical protein
MKFVVMGIPGVASRSISFSISKHPSKASEEKRLKSSRWVGLAKVGAARGGRISPHSE